MWRISQQRYLKFQVMHKLNVNFRGLLHFGKLSGGYFITTILNQALPFLILPILTRYLSPAEYGNLALFSFYLALSNALTGVSIPTVISKHFFSSDKNYIAKLVGNAIFINGVLSIITLVIILIAYTFFESYIELPLVWLVLIPVTSFFFIVFSMGLNVMRNSGKVVTFGKHQIGNTAINLVISLLLIVVLLWGWQGRVLGIIISFIVSSAIVFGFLKHNGFVVFEFSRDISKTILKLVIPLIPNSFQAVIIAQVGIFFIQYYYTKELLGLYSIGFQVAVMIQLLITTLNMSLSPFLYEQLSLIRPLNKVYLTRMLYAFFSVVVVGFLFLNLTAGIVLRIMTTPAFFGALEFVPWISLGFLFYGAYAFLMPILIKNEQQKFISIVTFINMFLMILFNFWFIGVFGYMGVVYAYCLTYFLMFLAFFFKAQQVMPLPWLRALKIWS